MKTFTGQRWLRAVRTIKTLLNYSRKKLFVVAYMQVGLPC